MSAYPVNIAAVIATLAQIQTRIISRFREHVLRQHQLEIHELDRWAERADPDELEVIVGERSILDEILGLADELAIVALYRVVELNTEHILRRRYGLSKAKKLYRFDRLKITLKQDLNLDIEMIPHFRFINELRLLNNAIKHSKKVSPDLAKYPGWVQGKNLANLSKAYDRFMRRDRIPSYLRRLGEAVIPK